MTNNHELHGTTTTALAAAHLVKSDPLLDLQNVGVQMTDVVQVREDERFLEVEAARNNVLGVLESKAMALL